eukprot:147274-Chlamydomonas_euryale.AAC.1
MPPRELRWHAQTIVRPPHPQPKPTLPHKQVIHVPACLPPHTQTPPPTTTTTSPHEVLHSPAHTHRTDPTGKRNRQAGAPQTVRHASFKSPGRGTTIGPPCRLLQLMRADVYGLRSLATPRVT